MMWFLSLLIANIWLSSGATALSCPLFGSPLESALNDDVSLREENFIFGLPQNCSSGELIGIDYCFSFQESISQGNLTVRLSLAMVERGSDSYRINDSILVFVQNYIIDKPCSKYCCRQEKLQRSVMLSTLSPEQQYVFEVWVDGIIILEHKEIPQQPGWSARVLGTSTTGLQGSSHNITNPSHKLIQFVFDEKVEVTTLGGETEVTTLGEGTEVTTTSGEAQVNTTGEEAEITTMNEVAITNSSSNTTSPSIQTLSSTMESSSTSPPITQPPTSETNTPLTAPSSSTSSPTSTTENAVPLPSIYPIVFSVTAVIVFLLVTIPSITVAFLVRRWMYHKTGKYRLKKPTSSDHNYTGSRALDRDVQLSDSFEQSNSLERTYQEVQEPHIYQLVQEPPEVIENTFQIYDEPSLSSQNNNELNQSQPQDYSDPYEESQGYELPQDETQLYEEPYEIPSEDHKSLQMQSQPYEEPRQSRSQLHEALVSKDNTVDQVESEVLQESMTHAQVYEDPIANGYVPEAMNDPVPYDTTVHHHMKKTSSRELLLQDNSYNTLQASLHPQPYEDTSLFILNNAHSTSADDLQEINSQMKDSQTAESGRGHISSVTNAEERIYHTLEASLQDSELSVH